MTASSASFKPGCSCGCSAVGSVRTTSDWSASCTCTGEPGGVESQLGSVRPGKLADVVLIDGGPAARISDVRKAVVTVKDGMVYCPEGLYAELGVKP